jgi:hypothetical protein
MSGTTKKLKSTVDGIRDRSRSPSRKGGAEVEIELTTLKTHIEHSNKRIVSLKGEIELSRRVTHGTVASEELA